MFQCIVYGIKAYNIRYPDDTNFDFEHQFGYSSELEVRMKFEFKTKTTRIRVTRFTMSGSGVF